MRTVRGLVALFALLMILSTATFITGAIIENHRHDSPTTSQTTHTDEGSTSHEETEGHESGRVEQHPAGSESVGGINTESTPIIIFGVALSVALAGATLRWPRRNVLFTACLICVTFALLDGSELVHQIDEKSNTVALWAAVTLALHAGAAIVAASAASQGRRDAHAATTVS